MVVYGSIEVELEVNYGLKYKFDILRSRSTFGLHSAIIGMNSTKDNRTITNSIFTLRAKEETTLTIITIEQLKLLQQKYSQLELIYAQLKTFMPALDYYNHITYDTQNNLDVLKYKFKRAVRRQVVLNRW